LAQLQRLVIAPAQKQDRQIALTPPQQHYLQRVLRLAEGDRFVAMDGRGQCWLAQLRGDDAADILEPLLVPTELPLPVTLIVALPKGSGFDEVVRCCTELGVATLMPVISDRTLLHPSPRKLERWRRIAEEAAEQAEREIVPEILEPTDFSAALKATSETNCHGYLAVAHQEAPHLLACLSPLPDGAIAIATGPEGGWTPAEIEEAIAVGFTPISLGRRVLRAVTAPIAALSIAASAIESNVRSLTPTN
jgi:16S rRNA (uracil1498-N3)-methyltransferase